MAGCCDDGCSLDAGARRQRRTLVAVLVINAAMFAAVLAAALYAGSTALLADSLDNLGDALTYALSLWAVARGTTAKARVALVKGGLILAGALVVLGQVGYRLAVPTTPMFEVMGLFSLLALAANGLCLYLLSRHRHEDVNMASVWECSRNDIVANLSVFAAAGGVWLTGRGWPDLVVGLALGAFLLRSALRVIGQARRELATA
ncbi:cation transporter [Thiohalospira sp.]|uniref:cation transporter n=1 Tax=Thiohalospira sp. TaxID=3080549 RepID=UPI0039811CC7